MLKICPEHKEIETRPITTRCPICGRKLKKKKKPKEKKQKRQSRHTNGYHR